MTKRKVFYVLVVLLAVAVPALAVFTGIDLDATLANLRRELCYDYYQISQTQEDFREYYAGQHQQMVEIAKKCNDQSLMLYSQKQDYTFDISYALEKVTQEYEDFNKNRTPYDRIVTKLNIEINRYARLIESLRRLPPELKEVELVPDSLAYHNDSLDAHLEHNESLLEQKLYEQVDLIMAIIATQDTLPRDSLAFGDSLASFIDTIDALVPHTKNPIEEKRPEPEEAIVDAVVVDSVAVQDTTAKEGSTSPFVLSEIGQMERDSCIFYASQLLKIYAQTREVVMADSTYYIEAWLRMKESYDYAQDYYKILQKSVFVDGQTPWLQILKHPVVYWRQAKHAMEERFSSNFLQKLSDYDESDGMNKDSRFNNSATLLYLVLYILIFFVLWGIAALLMRLVYRFVKPLDKAVAKEQRRYIALLLGCVLFILLSYETTVDERAAKSISLMHTFIFLLMAITTAQLIRLEPSKLKNGIRNYLSTIFTALFVISCRVLFLPNAFLNFIFPPLLLIMTAWQLIANLRRSKKSDRADAIIGWISLGVTAVAMFFSWAGYIFLALIILVWWFFLLTAILAIVTIWHLLLWYKEHRLDKRVEEHKAKITYLSGISKDSLMFSVTWFYDLIRDVVVPLLVLVSFPLCIRWALNIFEFNDLYRQIFVEPFVQHGEGGFKVSLYALLLLAGLFFVFRYLNKAIHTIWEQAKYNRFLRKYNRTTIRKNEINLSLGNSLISVFVWFVYIYIFIVTLNIPTSSLGLIAGGLSAGIGIALKDIINNFVYGIQLMGGRLRVGDWIECDGVRGAVTDINYQSTQIETYDGTTVSFLNSALFSKSFTNLTKSDSYECLKLHVSVAYGTDLQRARDVLVEAMQVMRTKDAYGREIVEPKRGIYVVFGAFGDSGVDIIVKQYVLAAERIAYADRAPEIMYNALNANGIKIPFPQRDVHMIKDDD
jgi:small-conductance mechanosensitive channel